MVLGYAGKRSLDKSVILRIQTAPAGSVIISDMKHPGLVTWGGHSAGDALCSLIILSDYLCDTVHALSLYGYFMNDVISKIKTDTFEVSAKDIDKFIGVL